MEIQVVSHREPTIERDGRTGTGRNSALVGCILMTRVGYMVTESVAMLRCSYDVPMCKEVAFIEAPGPIRLNHFELKVPHVNQPHRAGLQ